MSAKDSFTEMFNRALQKEFPESEHEQGGETDPGGFNNSVTENQVEPIRNFFAVLFLASIGMLIHVHFLWNHVDILLADVVLVIVIKTSVVTLTVKGFGYANKTSLLVGMSLVQIGEFAFVLLSRA